MIQLLLVRHGESVGNVAGILQGQKDFDLSERGWHQAQALGQRLARRGEAPTQVYSSPLGRAVQTWQGMQAALAFASLPPCCLDARLQEIDNGILAGLTWPIAQKRYPELCEALERSPDWIPIPQAESPQACYGRAQAFITDLHHFHHNGDRIWVITHAGILPYLVAALWGSDRTWGFSAHPTALFEFCWDGDRWLWFNQTSNQTSNQAPNQTPNQVPNQTSNQTPNQTPNQAYNQAHHHTQNRFNTTLWQIRSFNDYSHLEPSEVNREELM